MQPYKVFQSIDNHIAFLRLDASEVPIDQPGGRVNCQYGFGSWEILYIDFFTLNEREACAIESTAYPDVWLRMDPTGVGPDSPTGGVVDLVRGRTSRTSFYPHYDSSKQTYAFESTERRNVFLSMQVAEVEYYDLNGSGFVTCQYLTSGQLPTNTVPLRLLPVQSAWNGGSER